MRRQGEQAGVMVRQGALVPDLQHAAATPGPGRQRGGPSRSARGTNGRTTSSASVAGTLTAKGTMSPSRARTTCSAMVDARLVLGLAGAGPEVRRHHHLVELQQR